MTTKTTKLNVVVGGSLENAFNDFIDTWERAEAGEHVEPKRTISFESWPALVSLLSAERYRLLDHLHDHEEPSVSALARSLARPYRRVHDDVVALEGVGLLDRSGRAIRASVDSITTEIVFGPSDNGHRRKDHREPA
jgi:predicted transcriptional regulator